MAEGELLHPDLLHRMPIGGSFSERLLRKRVAEANTDQSPDPDISIVVRARNEAEQLEELFRGVNRQKFSGEVELVVVHNGEDRTQEVAESHGAEVVILPDEQFTYPKSMNAGTEAASNNIVFLTVAHALLSNKYTLHAGARHFNNVDVAGTFGTALPSINASRTERLAALKRNSWLLKPAHEITKVGRGVLGATGAMITKSVWEELGTFDERYESGGEDTALAGKMLQHGYVVILEPALSTHHSDRLGPFAFTKQVFAWNKTVHGPQRLSSKKLADRREALGQRNSVLEESR